MFNGKTKSIQYIVEKVFRDTGIAEGVDIYDAIEWAAEAMELIGAPQSYQERVCPIDITDGRGDLPCDLHLIMQTRIKTADGYVPMRYATDNFHAKVHCDDSTDLSCSSHYTYRVSDDCIFVDFDGGTLQMAYLAFQTDDKGWPVIPDDIKFVKAVEYYIREKIDYKLWRTGKVPQQVYEKTAQDQVWYLGAAQTRGVMPSVDEMENLKNNWIRLIPKINQHDDFFSTLGNPEQRNVNTHISSGLSDNEVDRDDYFDYLANNP
jgi:hypothetical protein